MGVVVQTSLPRQHLKMGLTAEPHSHPYNVNWVDKTAQSITQHCQVPIHMSSYEDRVWGGVHILDIDTTHILLGRFWLYDLDVISLGRSTLMNSNLTERK